LGSSSGSVDAGVANADGGSNGAELARVAGWLSNPNSGLGINLGGGNSGAYSNINSNFPLGAARDKLVNSIVASCTAFAPPLANWQVYCEAVITSAIVSESTYNPTEVVNDAYATMDGGANDPTVGLLQIRLSSTVHDYNYYGSLPKIAAIGCTWPSALTSLASGDTTTWHNLGGTATYLTFMEDPACNIPLATWYYFMNATGNGGPNAVYAADYCAGRGIAGNVVIGLLSHLQGPAFTPRNPNPPNASNPYPAGIKFRFVNLLGGLATPDPFIVTLSPVVTQYCR
jgi:hypothetical protein